MFDFRSNGPFSSLRGAPSLLRALALSVVLVLLLAAVACRQSPYEEAPESFPSQALAPLWEVWDILQEDFVDRDSMDPERLGAGAVVQLAKVSQGEGEDAVSLEPETRYRLPSGAPTELAAVWGRMGGGLPAGRGPGNDARSSRTSPGGNTGADRSPGRPAYDVRLTGPFRHRSRGL